MHVIHAPRVRAALLLSALLIPISACAGTGSQQPVAVQPAAAKPASAEQTEKLTAAVEDAQIELRLTQMKIAADALEAGEDLEDAQRDLEEAKLALTRFREVEMPTEIADGQLGIERGMQSLSESRQELAQMEAMYAAEPNLDASGQATRDMVLERHRKRVEFSQRNLELARTRFQDEVGSKLPLQQRKLEEGLRKASRDLRKAEHDHAKGELEAKRSLGKAERALKEAERKLAKSASGDGDSAKDAKDAEDEDGE